MSNAQQQTAVTVAKPLQLLQGGTPLKFSPEASRLMLTKNSKGDWTAEEVATIGSSDLLVIRNESGLVKAFKKTVRLLESKKEIAKVSKSWIVTVQGYNALNRFAGLHEITPPELMFDGMARSNPYVQYDAKGEIKKVIVRKMVIGFTVAGSLVATDVVRHYNFDAYYMQDLQNKAKWKPDSAKFGTELACPFAPELDVQMKGELPYVKTKEGKIYLFKRVKDIEGIWIDPTHSEIRDVYDQHIQHQKFGDVIAQNVASRNAKKAHPGIAATNVIAYGEEDNHYADVEVYGYRSTITKEEAEKISEKIRSGEQISDVEVSHSVEEASFEEVQKETETIVDDAAATEGGIKQPEEKKPEEHAPEQTQGPEVQRAEPKPATAKTTKKDTIALIREEGEKKGVDAEKMSMNVFQLEVAKLNEFQQDKLLSMLKKTTGGKGSK